MNNRLKQNKVISDSDGKSCGLPSNPNNFIFCVMNLYLLLS